jgi:hypothetical protein
MPPGNERLIHEDDLPDPATAEPPKDLDAPRSPEPLPRRRSVRYASDPHTGAPIVSFRGLVKRSMTKKSRSDLSTAMMGMCQLTGWRDTTLNPDLSNEAKLAIIAARFGKVAGTDDDSALYGELMGLAAVTVGAAQGIARRDARDRKRRSRAARKATKRAKREGKAGGKGGKGDQ